MTQDAGYLKLISNLLSDWLSLLPYSPPQSTRAGRKRQPQDPSLEASKRITKLILLLSLYVT
eukprot:767279-Hanusia_phi.AAC.1